MKACTFVCIIGYILFIFDQIANGLDYGRLFISGFVLVAIWTDSATYFRRKFKVFRRHIRHLADLVR